jgi:protein involved in polysaccharide export with SLBB domain
VNFGKFSSFVARISNKKVLLNLLLIQLLSIYLTGCSDQVRLPSAEQLVEFENAGPIGLNNDMTGMTKATTSSRAYRVMPGEVLELTMPTILQVVTKEESDDAEKVSPYMYRVSETGTITLKVVGEIKVAGKTLVQIESAIIDAYYPKYASIRPSIFVRLVERIEPPLFSVLGLVNKPGNFPYPLDVQYNLMKALGFAGGLDRAAEPRYATIYRLKPDGTIVSAIFQVVNAGNDSMLTDAVNIRIKPGDIVIIEHTPRTRTRLFLANVFRFNIGAYYRFDDVLGD